MRYTGELLSKESVANRNESDNYRAEPLTSSETAKDTIHVIYLYIRKLQHNKQSLFG